MKKKIFSAVNRDTKEMPFSIPTYFMSEFVRSATLEQRRNALKKILKSKFIFVSTFPMLRGVEYVK